jgi:sterol desaturase/sphingolipid hydroxylase (fatty acid hydroxylase superfamily)
MFESDLIDYFSRTHPLVVPALYVPGSAIPMVYDIYVLKLSLVQSFGLFVLGFISWTLTEYWLHRVVFHFKANGPWGKRVHFLIHGVHHQWPKDRYRLVMPPAVSISLYFLFAGLFDLVLGPKWMWAFHSGFVAGYLVYDMTHFATHHLRPLTAWGRQIRRHHLLHHAKDSGHRFGVSTPLWDWVFGTISPNEREHSS